MCHLIIIWKFNCVKTEEEDICSLPPMAGGPAAYCRALFYKWHYDPAAKECKKFSYGGCGGNENRYWMAAVNKTMKSKNRNNINFYLFRFNSKEECEERCKKWMKKSATNTSTIGFQLIYNLRKMWPINKIQVWNWFFKKKNVVFICKHD